MATKVASGAVSLTLVTVAYLLEARRCIHYSRQSVCRRGQLTLGIGRIYGSHESPFRKYYGPDFLGEAFTNWAKQAGMAIQYIQPGKPNQNAYIERFNRAVRDEHLDQHLFNALDDVREAVHWWMIEYNDERPHDALDDLTPMEARLQSAGNSTYELSP